MLTPVLLTMATVASAPAATQLHGTPVAALRDDCAASAPGVRINVSGLKDRSGRLNLELYPANANDFLKGAPELLKEGKVFRRVVAAVPPKGSANGPASGIVSLCVPTPGPGRYAVVVIHKRDGAAKFNISNDGVGLPGSGRIGRRRPGYEQAVVLVSDRVTTVPLQMQYLHGLAGFKPEAR